MLVSGRRIPGVLHSSSTTGQPATQRGRHQLGLWPRLPLWRCL